MSHFTLLISITDYSAAQHPTEHKEMLISQGHPVLVFGRTK